MSYGELTLPPVWTGIMSDHGPVPLIMDLSP